MFSSEGTGVIAAARVTGALTAAVITAKILAAPGRHAQAKELTVGAEGFEPPTAGV